MKIKKKYKQWWAEQDPLTGQTYYHGEPTKIKLILFTPIIIIETLLTKKGIILVPIIYITTGIILELPLTGWMYLGFTITMLYMILLITALFAASDSTEILDEYAYYDEK